MRESEGRAKREGWRGPSTKRWQLVAQTAPEAGSRRTATTFIACGSYLSLSRFRVASSSSIFVCPQCARLGDSVRVFLSYSARYLWIVNVYFGRRQRWRYATHVSRQKEEKEKEGWEKRMVEEKKLKRSTVVGCWEQGQCVQGKFEIKLHERFTTDRLRVRKKFDVAVTLKFSNVLKSTKYISSYVGDNFNKFTTLPTSRKIIFNLFLYKLVFPF